MTESIKTMDTDNMDTTTPEIMASQGISTVLFDADGTLIDTHDIILASMRHIINDVYGLSHTDEELMAGVGTPLFDQMLNFSGDENTAEELMRRYREHNDAIHDEGIRSFPDVAQALELLKSKGYRMGVVTSKRHFMANRGLELCHIAGFFEVLVGSDDCQEHKPLPGPILYACELMDVNPECCIYVGDSPYDIQAGNAAGCTSVAALWGMFSEAELMAEHPALSFSSLLDLAEYLKPVKHVAS